MPSGPPALFAVTGERPVVDGEPSVVVDARHEVPRLDRGVAIERECPPHLVEPTNRHQVMSLGERTIGVGRIVDPPEDLPSAIARRTCRVRSRPRRPARSWRRRRRGSRTPRATTSRWRAEIWARAIRPVESDAVTAMNPSLPPARRSSQRWSESGRPSSVADRWTKSTSAPISLSVGCCRISTVRISRAGYSPREDRADVVPAVGRALETVARPPGSQMCQGCVKRLDLVRTLLATADTRRQNVRTRFPPPGRSEVRFRHPAHLGFDGPPVSRRAVPVFDRVVSGVPAVPQRSRALIAVGSNGSRSAVVARPRPRSRRCPRDLFAGTARRSRRRVHAVARWCRR